MTTRRHLLIGGASLIAAGAAYALKPRRVVLLLPPNERLDQVIPARLGNWSSRDVGDLFSSESKDSLSAKLYETIVGRVYQNQTTGAEVLALFAYGGLQSNLLQLHRPEVCYPAFGFTLLTDHAVDIPLAAGSVLPTRQLTMRSPDNQQTVLYWTRIGEYLPRTGAEQRMDRMRTALAGYFTDGLLARFSMSGDDDAFAARTMMTFIKQLLRAIPARHLPGLIGTERARLLSGS